MKQIQKKDLEKLSKRKQVLFACFCAEQVLHLVDYAIKPVFEKVIEIAHLFLEGKATKEDCKNIMRIAAYTTYESKSLTAVYAAKAAAHTADLVYSVAYDAHALNDSTSGFAAAYSAYCAQTELSILEAQWAFYDQLLNGDKYFEEIVLGKV